MTEMRNHGLWDPFLPLIKWTEAVLREWARALHNNWMQECRRDDRSHRTKAACPSASPHGMCKCLGTHTQLRTANASQPGTLHVTFWFFPGPRSRVLFSEGGEESSSETEPTS